MIHCRYIQLWAMAERICGQMWTDVDRELFVALGSDENDVGNLCKIIL